jgi:hypothetical protein
MTAHERLPDARLALELLLLALGGLLFFVVAPWLADTRILVGDLLVAVKLLLFGTVCGSWLVLHHWRSSGAFDVATWLGLVLHRYATVVLPVCFVLGGLAVVMVVMTGGTTPPPEPVPMPVCDYPCPPRV